MRRKSILSILAAMTVILCCAFSACDLPFFGSDPAPLPEPHLISEGEAEKEPVRKIDEREERAVVGNSFYERQLSLAEVVADGFRPSFSEDGGDVKELYEVAISILDRYIKNDFTTYETVHAIHDYIAYNTVYDEELYSKFLADPKSVSSSHDSFNLAGVFKEKLAVCDGISKAFNLLCGIEGVRSVRIEGEYAGGAHAWNKVEIDGKWYNVDVTLDSARIDVNGSMGQYLHHGFFLLSDDDINSSPYGAHRADPSYIANPVNFDAYETYPVYEGLETEIDGKSYSILITSSSEFKELFKAAAKAGRKKIGKLEARIDIAGTDLGKVEAFDSLFRSAVKEAKSIDFMLDEDRGIRPFVRYPNGVVLILLYM